MIDNYALWEAHEREQERQRLRYPTCDHCGKTLWEYIFRIDGEVLCESCLTDIYREEVPFDE